MRTETAAGVTGPTTTRTGTSPVEAARIPFDSRGRIAEIGESWAALFAAGRDEAACRYQTQPLCERIACQRAGGFAIRHCTPPSSVFRRSFDDATVEDVEILGDTAGARFSGGQEVVFVFAGQVRWMIHRLRDGGRDFFE